MTSSRSLLMLMDNAEYVIRRLPKATSVALERGLDCGHVAAGCTIWDPYRRARNRQQLRIVDRQIAGTLRRCHARDDERNVT